MTAEFDSEYSGRLLGLAYLTLNAYMFVIDTSQNVFFLLGLWVNRERFNSEIGMINTMMTSFKNLYGK